MATQTRSSRTAKPDERSRTAIKVGGRQGYRVFKFPSSVSPKEIEARKNRLKEVYAAGGGWNDLSIYIAGHVFKGIAPVPLPDHQLCRHLNVEYDGWVAWRALLISKFPSISWEALGESQIAPSILGAIRQLSTIKLNEAAEVIASIDRRPSGEPVKPIAGSLHEGIDAYSGHIQKIQPTNFDRHAKIRQLRQRHPDQPLATLGLEACREMVDYWRQRPPKENGKGQYSVKRSREQLRELTRFFEWLHLSEVYAWREPEDFRRLDQSISTVGVHRRSILESKMPTFSLEELAFLVRHASMPERLWILWCLNNSHGAAEVGRVQWGDIYLDQDHPWKKDGLNLWSGGDWIGFRRPKTHVIGWWLLWPETVKLLLDWKPQCQRYLGREILQSDPILVTSTGKPLYKNNKNGQSGFYKAFDELKKQTREAGHSISNLPPGTLRDQFSDWCGGDEGDATVAAVALAHGIPHKEDRLLYKHYANRPWRKLFEKQQEFRAYCKPVLEALAEKPPLPKWLEELMKLWPSLVGGKLAKVKDAAKTLQVSKSTIYRYLEQIRSTDNEMLS